MTYLRIALASNKRKGSFVLRNSMAALSLSTSGFKFLLAYSSARAIFKLFANCKWAGCFFDLSKEMRKDMLVVNFRFFFKFYSSTKMHIRKQIIINIRHRRKFVIVFFFFSFSLSISCVQKFFLPPKSFVPRDIEKK
ncbi:hypothetical protein WN66_02707 [Saccharomyces cerevisiae]|uniref:Putative uncharacterized protein YGR265W n=1 Tax=Saccharomyces cerevisiae (strain ATCC 204508 / S288c) TaxID=559292 RepID=YG5K_YEAST|nr:RecName: Full=Putative uncharacterized protein YGR265W [Saccharomyces cerevisiae S288C]AAT93356.1 YGR265W [Saccharomyces cerevisiae]KZV11499.1 hypothetical protein WN66_02707 [Saccharomyces cerevisiae]CAA69087.1 unnamed protein product [Saccharomyces cerevisiae]CAA97294.1 unnamed protein product [Saccharomyces cerevisiae]